jgi:predicted secreted protein
MSVANIQHEHIDLVLYPGLGLRGKRTFQKTLDSNASTGYSWTERERCIPSILDVSHHYCQHQGPPGTGGTDTWAFTAKAVGQEVVKLAYAPESDPEDVSEWVVLCFKVG